MITSFFRKLKCFPFILKLTSGVHVLNSSGLKNVFEKLFFLDGLVWTADLTVDMQLRCQISAA